MDVKIVPCSVAHIEKLIAGADAFLTAYGLQVADGYLPFAGALDYSLKMMQTSQTWSPWLPYLLVFDPQQILVGFGGFKSVPDFQRTVEIGYSVAPNYQGRGFATSMVEQLMKIAFTSELVECVCAHTLAQPSASTRVLEKCGMTRVSEFIDVEDGKLWRWEIGVV
ncbi:MAG: GNAT family N-acetyltransferase [Desmonostoc vinosum HA7617-LM4]|jgi:RimJ/RimL family protein N-acetyltransferase|nr:GNAT family N-acetyltransferase [Desmonostoc vinosum HA7617-LM4]